MAIRFMDTNFFRSPFVRGLKGASKTLYCFIILDCDYAGIWIKDLEIASVLIGMQVGDEDFKTFIEKEKAFDLGNGKYFFPDFIEHQYPKGLQETNPAHKNIISTLKEYNILDDALKVLIRPSKGSISNGNSNSKGKSEGNSNNTGEKSKKVPVMSFETEKLALNLPFSSPKFVQVWNVLIREPKWLKKSVNALKSALIKLGSASEEDAVQMMLNSIEGNWQGIFELKGQSGGKKSGLDALKNYANGKG